jgi:GT2 family glycosyltransferase
MKRNTLSGPGSYVEVETMKIAPDHSGKVAVIVLNYNKKEDLLECVGNVLKSTGPTREVVVVDNGSIDDSGPTVARVFPKVHLVQSSRNLGASGGRNLGIDFVRRNIHCRYVLFLDNDATIHERCIGELTAALDKDPAAAIACPKTFRKPESDLLFSTGMRVHLATASIYDIGSGQPDRGQYDRAGYVDACGAFALLIRRDLLDMVGGFDEALNPYGWEDVDLCLRARGSGYRTLYVPTAVAYHRGGMTGRGRVPRYEHFKARNFVTLMKKHARPLEWMTAAVFAPLKASATILGEMGRGNFKTLLPVLRGGWKGMTGR